MGEKDSQLEPDQKSGLQTPQPDQPIPSEPRPLDDETAETTEPLQHDHDDN